MLTWSKNYDICEADRATTLAITYTKFMFQYNSINWRQYRALEQLKSGFK